MAKENAGTKLNKLQIKEARIRIEKHHQEKLIQLQGYILEGFNQLENGKIDAFELDRIIHLYHRQSQELYSFIDFYYQSDNRLQELLTIIASEENGGQAWEPKTKQS
jgi:hypothetical protein